jgi:hypothetical protein
MNMMKRFFLLVVLVVSLSIRLLAQSISYVETTRSWHYIYDEKGRKIHTVSTSQGTIPAYGSSFYILQSGSFLKTFDPKGRRLATLSISGAGQVVGASGDTFTTKLGGWLYTWSKEGKKLSVRWVQR